MPITRKILTMRNCYSPPITLPFYSQRRCAGMKYGSAAVRKGMIRNYTLCPVTKKKMASSRVMMKPMESSIWKDVTGPCPIYMPRTRLIITFQNPDTVFFLYNNKAAADSLFCGGLSNPNQSVLLLIFLSASPYSSYIKLSGITW